MLVGGLLHIRTVAVLVRGTLRSCTRRLRQLGGKSQRHTYGWYMQWAKSVPSTLF